MILSFASIWMTALTLLATDAHAAPAREAPHLELELESRDYARLLDAQPIRLRSQNSVNPAADLTDLIQIGKRNLDFLDHLNSKRPVDQKLNLTSPELQPGYPIDAPKESSPRILREKMTAIRSEAPAELGAILFGNQTFPDSIGLDDITYLTWARKLDGVYQGASRWTLQEPYLESYKSRATKDVRGYYYLTREPNWQDTLTRWDGLGSSEKARLRPWILSICVNATRDSVLCKNSLTSAETTGTVLQFTQRHLPKAKGLWDSYFKLGGRRSDITWRRDNPNLASMPFKDPRDPTVKRWLLNNVEDEWRLDGWTLKLDFKSQTNWGTAEVVFIPGATPHVNGLGGNTITMDANQALEEYGTRWTIRHEFGHVLGLPDCYVEFYEEEKQVMVSYQLDLGNLMCSRRGKLQKIHYDELKSAYFR